MLAATIRKALADYAPSDDREGAFRERMLALCDSGDPFSRTSFAPGHFTASAFVLSPDRERVLLIFHKKLARWLQPGGHVEPTDVSIAGAAQREVEEETAVLGTTPVEAGLFDIDIHDIPARRDAAAHEHFDLRVLLVAPDVAVRANDEVEAVRWVKLADVEQLETDESVLRAVRKLRRRV
ncbi:MAG TPA: NUDIX hydrolase [Polyangiaceae bacterium]|nr:NUDIX hydrolase [Polyangiaceae bacterium]